MVGRGEFEPEGENKRKGGKLGGEKRRKVSGQKEGGRVF